MSSETTLPGRDASVTLREIMSDTLQAIIDLKVRPEQEPFVAANVVSIAQAYFHRDILWFRAIYADETPVGFVMVAENPAEQEWYLSRLMIDARYQGCGYGDRAPAGDRRSAVTRGDGATDQLWAWRGQPVPLL